MNIISEMTADLPLQTRPTVDKILDTLADF